MIENQPSLFPEQNGDQADARVIPFDQAAAAAHIAENAALVEYPDRTSEAARDQGWGPIEPTDNVRGLHTIGADSISVAERTNTRSRHPSAGRFPLRGDTELDTELSPHYHGTPDAPLTEEQKKINVEQARKARKLLRLIDNDLPPLT